MNKLLIIFLGTLLLSFVQCSNEIEVVDYADFLNRLDTTSPVVVMLGTTAGDSATFRTTFNTSSDNRTDVIHLFVNSNTISEAVSYYSNSSVPAVYYHDQETLQDSTIIPLTEYTSIFCEVYNGC